MAFNRKNNGSNGVQWEKTSVNSVKTEKKRPQQLLTGEKLQRQRLEKGKQAAFTAFFWKKSSVSGV